MTPKQDRFDEIAQGLVYGVSTGVVCAPPDVNGAPTYCVNLAAIASVLREADRKAREECAEIAFEQCRRLNEEGLYASRHGNYERADQKARSADECARVATRIRASIPKEANRADNA